MKAISSHTQFCDLYDRIKTLSFDLAAHCLVADPSMDQQWTQLALEIEFLLDAFEPVILTRDLIWDSDSTTNLTLLHVTMANLMLIAHLCEQSHQTVFTPEMAESIAQLLVNVGSFVKNAYAVREAGPAVAAYVRDAAHAATSIIPLKDAFIQAITHNDLNAAAMSEELLRVFEIEVFEGKIFGPASKEEGR